MVDLRDEIESAVRRRRNFAIISHPDAGKTTLTEKLLLYGGALHEAGAVKSRRARRHATSDWMELERRRGISVTATVLRFDYRGFHLNLLDTPGHQDFSEDTYRTLSAADNAVLLIDHAKGVEAQTRKLFEVCRGRSLPTFTFVNKLDRAGRPPLDLLDEIERELGLTAYAADWPVGTGGDFRGVFDRRSRLLHLFERRAHGHLEAPEAVVALDDPAIGSYVDAGPLRQLKEEVEILDRAGPALDLEAARGGRLTPVFFGSALTNFGVKLFFDSFLDYAAQPGAFKSSRGDVPPTCPDFSGFVFKIQANMDPHHRDCLAFMRVCSGKFTRDMRARHARTGRTVRLARPQKIFAGEREAVEEAYPGDVVGLNNPGVFSIGDTLHTGAKLVYPAVPSFAPELFASLRNPAPSLAKKFRRGVSRLEEEGAVQILRSPEASNQELILAAVGWLQFEVVQFRLASEYGVETRLDLLPYTVARWAVEGAVSLRGGDFDFGVLAVEDRWRRPVILFKSEWHLEKVRREHPGLRLSAAAPAPAA